MTTTASKRPFSLLEMVVVLAILAFIGSLVGVKGKDLIEHYTFSSAIDKVSSRCKLAQSLAENYQTDVQVQIIRTRNGVDIALQSDEPPLAKAATICKALAHQKHCGNAVQ